MRFASYLFLSICGVITTEAWAGNIHLKQAMDQVHAAEASFQSDNPIVAQEHTRAALSQVEILRREAKSDADLKTAESALKKSINQNQQHSYPGSIGSLRVAADALAKLKH